MDFAEDVLAGIDFLKSRSEINPEQIGLIGHSEGGIIAPIAAAQSPDVAFIVLMAGTGLTGEEILYLQGALIAKANGASDEAIEEALIAGGNEHYTIKKLTGLNHMFQTSTSGSPAEYAKIEETVSPTALRLIGDWILKLTKEK